MNEKQNLELAACTYFLNSYNALHGSHFEIIEQRDKPDFLIQDSHTGEKLGIEVTHLFYDATEAQMMLGRRPHELHGVMNLCDLIEKLNADLATKVDRAAKYDFEGKLFLLIRVASPIFDRNDFDMHEDDIRVPTLNTFAEIWLLFWSQDSKSYSDLKQIQ